MKWMMKQEHIEILLEQIAGDTRLVMEGLDGVNTRLDRLEACHERDEGRLEILEGGMLGLKAGLDDLRVDVKDLQVGQEKLRVDVKDLQTGQEKLQKGQDILKTDVRTIKRSIGLLGPVAGDHETRLQALEGSLRDHLADNS